MKFFDPKKKEQNSSSPTPSVPAAVPPSPMVQPAPPSPVPVTHPPVPAAPAAPAPPAVSAPDDSAPTVMIPVLGIQPPEPAPLVPEPPPPPKPVLVTQRLLPQDSGQTVFGPTVMVKGDVTANESILVEGFIEGSIETTGDVNVEIGGKVYATIRAENIKISGRVVGNITASNKVEIQPSGLLEGNIRAPRLSISESALFRGSIDMRPVAAKVPGDNQAKEKSPASTASPEPA